MYNNNQPPIYPPPDYPYPDSQHPGGQSWLSTFGPDSHPQQGYQDQTPEWYLQQQQQQHPQHQQMQPTAGPSNGYNIPASYQNNAVYSTAPAPTNSGPASSTFQSSFSPHQSSNATPETNDAKPEKLAVGAKKKRKKAKEEGASPGAEISEKEKRTKTGRACDACRTKKIRCDILPPEEVDGHGQPICAHCKQYDLECTFFLPITETRFKKRRATEEQSQPPLPPTDSVTLGNAILQNEAASPRQPVREVPDRIEGPTSLSFLLHTSLPASASEAYDLREHSKWEVLDDGNGVIRVSAPPNTGRYADPDPDDPTKSHNRLNRPVLSTQIMSLLVNAYFDHVAPMFPIVSRADFVSKSSVSPFLLYAICGLGATRRQFPREVFSGVRGVINGLLRSNDILSDARLENVQALVGDLHAQPNAATASASLIRMATAVRMAQDLGLHRESTARAETAQDLAFVELRRRIWATCVIFDRWYAAALGIPQLIDLLDCDVLLPAPYDILPDSEPTSWPINTSYLALSEHLKLTILIGRTLKTHYSPTGLKHTTDAQLETLLADITSWMDNLPDELRFKGPSSSMVSGLLHMAHAALQFLFWRVFMRIQYRCPPHLNLRLHSAKWDSMVKWSTESIQWLDHNDVALDTLFVYPYTATSCALIQYHTWARRRSDHALEMLKTIKDTATRWEKVVQPDQMSIRRKTCETMTLLYEAALKTNPEIEEPKDRPAHINPTYGVEPRDSVGRIVWIKDETRVGGGMWVAATEEDRQDAGVPHAECLLESDLVPGSEQAKQFASMKNNDFGKVKTGKDGVVVPTVNDIDRDGNRRISTAITSDEALQRDKDEGPRDGFVTNGEVEQIQPGASQGSTDFFPDMQISTNLNPQLNGEGEIPVVTNQPLGGYPQATSPLDFTVLDGLPMASFDFPSWEQYFQAINSAPGQGPEGFV